MSAAVPFLRYPQVWAFMEWEEIQFDDFHLVAHLKSNLELNIKLTKPQEFPQNLRILVFALSSNLPLRSLHSQVLKGWVGEEKGFDPLGVTDALPVYWVREAELKHGRVCMLATVGALGHRRFGSRES